MEAGYEHTAPKVRTRDNNPIRQGEYTIEDYLREQAENRHSTEGLQFTIKVSLLDPEEAERLIAIDSEAKRMYEAEASEDMEAMWARPEFRPGRISGLTYYQRFYELTDEEAAKERLKDLKAIVGYVERLESRYIAIKEAADRSPEYIEALRSWLSLVDKTRMMAGNDEEEAKEDIMDIARRNMEGDDLDAIIAKETESLRRDCEKLEGAVSRSYRELREDPEASKALDIIESKISREIYLQFFGPFREAYGEEGYEGAIARIYRRAMTTDRAYLGDKPLVSPGNMWNGFGFVALMELMAQQGDVPIGGILSKLEELRRGKGYDRDSPALISTLEMARQNPFPEPTYDIITRDKYTRSFGTKAMRQECLKGVIEGDSVYRNAKEIDGKLIEEIASRITVKNLNGRELSADDMSLLSDISALQKAHEEEIDRKGGPMTPLKISEGKLLSYRYGVKKMEATKEQRDELFDSIVALAGRVVEIDVSELLKEYPDMKARMDSMFPPGEIHDGKFGGNELEFRYDLSRNPRPSKIESEDGTRTEEHEVTRWYTFKRYPLSVVYSKLVNQVSLVSSELRKTPTLYESREDGENVLSDEAIQVLKKLERKGVDLWKGKKDKDGKKTHRYISLNKSREFPTLNG